MTPTYQAGVPAIDAFNFYPGRMLAGKYEVISHLGAGWEGEVYLIREHRTDIERTAKFFFPQRNIGDKAANFYAKKLHKLRQCPVVIQYHTQEIIKYRGFPVTMLVSEFVEGELLSDFITRQPSKRLTPFQGIHLLHALLKGIECVHQAGEYHGDLHSDNIIVCRYGLEFELKLLDFYHWGKATTAHFHDDIIDLIRIFYDALGGKKYYAAQPAEVKAICCGLKRSLILKKFKTTDKLRAHLETMAWS